VAPTSLPEVRTSIPYRIVDGTIRFVFAPRIEEETPAIPAFPVVDRLPDIKQKAGTCTPKAYTWGPAVLAILYGAAALVVKNT
jgi:hypothetical protein